MKHQLSTIVVLALIAVPVGACGSTTDGATEKPAPTVGRTENRLYESDLVSQALTATRERVYESDLVSQGGAGR